MCGLCVYTTLDSNVGIFFVSSLAEMVDRMNYRYVLNYLVCSVLRSLLLVKTGLCRHTVFIGTQDILEV